MGLMREMADGRLNSFVTNPDNITEIALMIGSTKKAVSAAMEKLKKNHKAYMGHVAQRKAAAEAKREGQQRVFSSYDRVRDSGW